MQEISDSRPPVEVVDGGDSSILLICDHATNIVPPEVGDLGVSQQDLGRHIAYDVGARGVTLELARLLNAPAVLSRFSRLVIDPNRGEDDPTLVMKLYDGSIIPGNRHADRAEVERRLDLYHRPYHRALSGKIDQAEQSGVAPVLVSIHSFTPQLRGRPPRPWHVGVLWDRDDRLARPLIDGLLEDPGLVVGDNEPYSGQLAGDCMWMHGTSRGLRHALIEIRNDLIAEPTGQRAWAERLAVVLKRVCAGSP